MDFGILGPLVVRRDEVDIQIGAPKQRALLIYLLLRHGQAVAVDRLIDGLWEDNPPPRARVTLRSYVSALRRLLAPDAEGGGIVTRGSGYALEVAPDAIDAVRFSSLADQARVAAAGGDHAAALTLLDDALALWRGDALADVAGSAFAVGERARLEELRLSALEDRFDALIALGRHAEAVGLLEAFLADAPLRERGQAQLMLALYRSGRAADALASFRRYRVMLADELGLDPAPGLQQLAERILRHEEQIRSAPDATHVAAVATEREQLRPGTDAAPRTGGVVGRTHELAELRRAVEWLRAGTGGLLLIAGEPGIGKSTLLEELAAATPDEVPVRWGRCQQTRGAPAFWPWIQVVRAVAGGMQEARLRDIVAGPAAAVTHLIRDLAAWADTPPALSDDLEAARFQLYDALAAFLIEAARQRGLVVLFDDLHWADPPSLEMLAFLTPMLGSARLLIAATYRDVRAEWAHDLEAALATVVREPLTQQVGLVGLQPEAVAELAEQQTGRPLSIDERALLHRRTDGNPFFVRQLAQLLSETGGDETTAASIPSGIAHVIARRLAPLPDNVRELLEAAAVVGGQFDVRWVAGTIGFDVDEALDAADVAAEHGLIVAVGRSVAEYRFVHALIRETIYESLPRVRAARTHARVGLALEQAPRTPVSMLAEHFRRAAEVGEHDRAVRYLRAAADDALQVFAHEQAEAYLRQALQLLVGRRADTATELQVRMQLAELLIATYGWSSPEVEVVAEPARRLAQAAGSHPDMIPLWEALFVQYWTRGRVEVAKEMSRRLRSEADEGGHPAAIAASRLAASELEVSLGGDAERALYDATEAEHHAQLACEAGDAVAKNLWIQAIYMVAFAHALLGRSAAAVEAARRAITLAETQGGFHNVVAWMVAGYVGMIIDDPTFAAETSATASHMARERGFPWVATMAAVSDAWAAARLGEDPAENATRMEEAIEALERTGMVDGQAKRLLFAAETYLLAQDPTAATRCVEKARAFAAVNGETLPTSRLDRIAADTARLPASRGT